jgi:hypothetical protein
MGVTYVIRIGRDWLAFPSLKWQLRVKKGKGKGKVIPLHAVEAHGVRGGIAPTHPGTHCAGGWVNPRAGLDAEARGKILYLYRGSNPGLPVRSQTLYWLSYPGWQLRVQEINTFIYYIYICIYIQIQIHHVTKQICNIYLLDTGSLHKNIFFNIRYLQFCKENDSRI